MGGSRTGTGAISPLNVFVRSLRPSRLSVQRRGMSADGPVFVPRDTPARADGKSDGATTPAKRKAAITAAFEVIGALSPDRYVPPPLQQLISEYAQTRCMHCGTALLAGPCARSFIDCFAVVLGAQCVPVRSAD
jgi:hypothetical protein